MIKVEVIADSISEIGNRVTTLACTYERYIHAEVMTHRMFSRNASSSRAIPIQRTIQAIKDNPVIPIFVENQKGMQADNLMEGETKKKSLTEWLLARDDAITHAEEMMRLGGHKQIVNRILEPYSHITTLITSTEWDNFFSLRITPHAQQEICQLAIEMRNAINKSIPNEIRINEWHLPFVSESEKKELHITDQKMVSVARCARVSYLNHDKSEPVKYDDILLHNRLKRDRHSSPFEHVLTPMLNSKFHANSRGWQQYRSDIENE